MNKLNTLIVTVLSILIVCGGCKKTEETPTYFMKATVDGVEYKATDLTYSTSYSPPNNYTYITGTGVAGSNLLSISLIDFNGATGPIPIGLGNASVFINFGKSSSAKKGTITITSVSPTLAGTFHFTCYDSTEVTDGSFSCPNE